MYKKKKPEVSEKKEKKVRWINGEDKEHQTDKDKPNIKFMGLLQVVTRSEWDPNG